MDTDTKVKDLIPRHGPKSNCWNSREATGARGDRMAEGSLRHLSANLKVNLNLKFTINGSSKVRASLIHYLKVNKNTRIRFQI